MLWESGEKNGNEMRPFDETNLREILDSAMTKVHLAQLLNVDWNHHEKPYAESIAKLESLEPQIILHNEHEKRLTALEGQKTPSSSSSSAASSASEQGSDSNGESENESSAASAASEQGSDSDKEISYKMLEKASNKKRRSSTSRKMMRAAGIISGYSSDSSSSSRASSEDARSRKKRSGKKFRRSKKY